MIASWFPAIFAGSTPPPEEPTLGLSIEISDVDVTPYLLQDSVNIDRALDNRGSMKLGLRDDTRTKHYQPGQTVFAYWDGVAVFGGKIESVSERLPRWTSGPLMIEIEVSDWSKLFDRFVVAYVYDPDELHTTGWTLAQIVADIVDVQTPLGPREGITVGTVAAFTFEGKYDEATKVGDKRVHFKYQRASDCLGELCQKTGCSWSVSPLRVLNIRDRSTFDAPFTIGEGAGGIQTYRDLESSRSIEQYRNVQWMLGGKDRLASQKETFHGETTSAPENTRNRTFTVMNPVAQKPTITRISSAGVRTDQRVGLRGVDKDGDVTMKDPATGDETWPQWFWRSGDTEISQNTENDAVKNPTLSPEETLEVDYVGYYDIIWQEIDETQVESRKTYEGGSGVYEAVEEDEKLDTVDLITERTKRLLEQFGRVPATLKYEVDRADVEPGHLQSIVISDLAINAQYMVDEISCSFPKFTLMRTKISALDGERQMGWTEFWKRTLVTGRVFSIRENEVVMKMVKRAENIAMTDALVESVHGSVTCPGILEDPFSIAFIGTCTDPITGATYPLARVGWSMIGVPETGP